MEKALALIPARGGSKGIQRKNLVQVKGRPMIAWSIEHALRAATIDRVVVSTDDVEIREIALACGAEVPFLRPRELGEDHVLDLPVFEHALKALEGEGYVPSFVVHLRPTAPIRRPEWIDQAVCLLQTHSEADSVRSVSMVHQHPYRTFRIGLDGFLIPLMQHEHPCPYLLRRQDLPPVYYYNCVIDVTRPSTIFGQQSMTGARMLAYVMDPDVSFDVDSPRDLEIVRLFAESLL